MRNPLYTSAIMAFTGLILMHPLCVAGELQQGQTLHDEDCLVCHDSAVYRREERQVQTLGELLAQVKRCQEDVGAEWGTSQFEAVVAYLNGNFYHFNENPPASQ